MRYLKNIKNYDALLLGGKNYDALLTYYRVYFTRKKAIFNVLERKIKNYDALSKKH